MIKVLQLTEDASLVGVSLHILTLAEYLPKASFEMHIACPAGPLVKELKKKGVKTHSIASKGLGGIKSIRTLIKQEKFDIVHSQTLQIGFYTALATVGLDVKFLHSEHQMTRSFHDSLKYREMIDYFKLFIINLLSFKIIASSQAIKRFLIQTIGVKEWKIQVILPGLEKEKERKKKTLAPILGYIGPIDKQSILPLLRAVKILKAEFADLKLEICSQMKKGWRRMLEQNMTKGLVRLVEKEKMQEVVQDWQIFVQPTCSEHIAENIIFGMSQKKPVVATQTEGVEEFVLNELTGISVSKGSTEKLVKEIGFLLRNPREAERIAQNGYKLFEKRYDAREMIDEYVAFYSGIV